MEIEDKEIEDMEIEGHGDRRTWREIGHGER